MEALLESWKFSRLSERRLRISDRPSWPWIMELQGVLDQMIVWCSLAHTGASRYEDRLAVDAALHCSTEYLSWKWFDCGLAASLILEGGQWSDAEWCRRLWTTHASLFYTRWCRSNDFRKLLAARSCNSRVSNVRCRMLPCWLRHV